MKNKHEEEFQKGIFGHIHWKRLKWGFYVVAAIMVIMGYWIPAILCLAGGILVNPKIKLPFKQSIRFILLGICLVAIIISAGTMQDKESYVDAVKGAINDEYPNVCYGDAFDAFFENANWKYNGKNDTSHSVIFTGKCLYNDSTIKVKANFADNEDGTVELTYLSYNDVKQGEGEMANFLYTILDSYSNGNSDNKSLGSSDDEATDTDQNIAETDTGLSYDFDKDVENGLLYSNSQGQIIDEAGNVIPEYSDIEVQANGGILSYGEVMESYVAGAGGKIIKNIPEAVDYGTTDNESASDNTNYDSAESATDNDTYENEETSPEPTSAIPENPNTKESVDETINNKINGAVDDAADGLMNGLMNVFVGMADSGVDKRNIDMYYGTWYDSDTGKYIYIEEGKGSKDYKIDLSDVGYGKNVSGTFTSSQTIYMGSIGMGIIMNDDGSIYIDNISITGKEPLGGHYVKQ